MIRGKLHPPHSHTHTHTHTPYTPHTFIYNIHKQALLPFAAAMLFQSWCVTYTATTQNRSGIKSPPPSVKVYLMNGYQWLTLDGSIASSMKLVPQSTCKIITCRLRLFASRHITWFCRAAIGVPHVPSCHPIPRLAGCPCSPARSRRSINLSRPSSII
jgi:hypothetical protein